MRVYRAATERGVELHASDWPGNGATPTPGAVPSDWQERPPPSGHYVSGGWFLDESNTDVQPRYWRGVQTDHGIADRMRRQEPVIARMLDFREELLVRATWEWEPHPASKDARQQEAADWLSEQFHGRMRGGWPKALREILSHEQYGMCLVVPQFVLGRDGGYELEAFGWVGPWVVYRWLFEPETGALSEVDLWYPPSDQTMGRTRELLPAWRIMHFARAIRGQDLEGISLLRPAWAYWEFKRSWLLARSFRHQRWGAGFPVFSETASGIDSKALRDQVKEFADEFYDAPNSYAYVPYGLSLKLEDAQDPFQFGEGFLRYCDLMMLFSAGVQFLLLGQGETGTYALSADQTSVWLQSLQATADYVCSVLSGSARVASSLERAPLAVLVESRFPGLDRMPRLTCKGLQAKDAQRELTLLVQAVAAGAIEPRAVDVQNLARDLVGLEPVPEPAEPASVTTPAVTPAPVFRAHRAGTPSVQGPGGRFIVIGRDGVKVRTFRDLTPTEGHVAWGSLDRWLDEAQDAWTSEVRELNGRHAREYREAADAAIQAGDLDGLDQLARGETLDYSDEYALIAFRALAHLDLRIRRDMNAELDARLKAQARGGPGPGRRPGIAPQENARRPASGAAEAQNRATALGRQAQDRMAVMLAETAKAVVDGASPNDLRGVRVPEKELLAWFRAPAAFVLNKAREEVVEARTGGRTAMDGAAAIEAKGALAAGLGAIADEARGEPTEAEPLWIGLVVYSAVLDEKTCDVCLGYDGEELTYGSAEYQRLRPPNPECLGRKNCRCVYVYSVGAVA